MMYDNLIEPEEFKGEEFELMRKLASVQVIEAIETHPYADRLEVARILGWQVVVAKDTYTAGDKVCFFEVDAILRSEVFGEAIQPDKKPIGPQGIVGFRVRSKLIRGILSQGFVLPLDDQSLPVGTDLTETLKVVKWEEQQVYSGESVGPYREEFAPKSDAVRVQNLVDHWDEIVSLKWVPTLKVDGSSTTLVKDGEKVRVFSRNRELTEKSQAYGVAESIGLLQAIRNLPDGTAVQAELVGPKIQSNRLKLTHTDLIVFAVFRDGVKVPREDWPVELHKWATPILDGFQPEGMLDDMIAKVDGLNSNYTDGAADEGIVFHLAKGEVAPLWMDRNANFKILNNSYLLAHRI